MNSTDNLVWECIQLHHIAFVEHYGVSCACTVEMHCKYRYDYSPTVPGQT